MWQSIGKPGRACGIALRNPEERKPPRRPRRQWEDNKKACLKGVRRKGMK
jgi:hypothetical protein